MSVSRKCDEPSCRKRYIAKRADSRFCSAACRQRAARSSKPETKLEVVPDVRIEESDVDPIEEIAQPKGGPVYRSTLEELEAAGREGTALGQSALTLARRLDAWTSLDTGSSLGSLAKALADLLAQATKGSGTGEGDPVTELRKRREERRRRGA